MRESFTDVQIAVTGGIMSLPGKIDRSQIDDIISQMARFDKPPAVMARDSSGQAVVRNTNGSWQPGKGAGPVGLDRSLRVFDTKADYGFGLVHQKMGDCFLASFSNDRGYGFSCEVKRDDVRVLPERIVAKVIPLVKDDGGFWQDRGLEAREFDVTAEILGMAADDIVSIRDNDGTSDYLGFQVGFPWPFRVEIETAVERYFNLPAGSLSDVDRTASLSEFALQQCRQLSGIETSHRLGNDMNLGT